MSYCDFSIPSNSKHYFLMCYINYLVSDLLRQMLKNAYYLSKTIIWFGNITLFLTGPLLNVLSKEHFL